MKPNHLDLGFLPEMRTRRAAVGLVVLFVCVFMGWAARPAQAIIGSYCPPTSGLTIGLYAYGTSNNRDRCAHAYHSTHIAIDYRNFATNVEKCAVLKPNSNGSGGNVGGLPAGCATRRDIAVQYPTGLGGHATGINKGANYHTGFNGLLQY